MEQTMLWSRETVLEAEPRSASRAREFVAHELAMHDLSHLADDVRLVASELATNAVRHARTPFRVVLQAVADSVLLSVQDSSPGSPAHNRADPLDMSGRGLEIVALVSSDWGVTVDDQGAKSVWASFLR
jgi:anti-sigma regulatory factor (Ser/Thr protein kinase)